MHVRIKICGITSPADAIAAASVGADMIGLNFYGKSPRHIDLATATAIVQALPTTVEAVALFVQESVAHAQRVSQSLGIGTVQMHGDHSEVLAAGTRWMPAFSVRDALDLVRIKSYLDMLAGNGAAPHAILVDAHVRGMFGGTGQVAPWHLLADFDPGVPLLLAGGLTPDNVAEAIRTVRPWGVDVASGVDSVPGKKDVEKMRRFVGAVRGAEPSVRTPPRER